MLIVNRSRCVNLRCCDRFRYLVSNYVWVSGMRPAEMVCVSLLRSYDRYWQGRTSWSDIMRTSRTCARLIWYHVPLRMGPAPKKDDNGRPIVPLEDKGKASEQERVREVRRLMAEKKMALELIEGYASLRSPQCAG